MKDNPLPVKRFLASFLLTGLLFGFVSCKKTASHEPAKTITVQASTIVLTLSAMEEPTRLSAIFEYEGTRYSIVADRVNAGSQNGAAQVANNRVIPPMSMLDPKSSNIIGIKNPAYSNMLIFSIDSFLTVYGTTGIQRGMPVDVTQFNKVMVLFTPDTQFWIYGDTDFPKKYGTDLEGLTKITSKAAAFINDYQPAIVDEQRLPVAVSVYK